MSERKPWVDLSARYGANGEYGAWKLVQEDYYWDRIDQAYEAARSLGAGPMGLGITTYRMIEAEWMTRRESEQVEVNDWLTIEWVASDAELPFEPIRDQILRSCKVVADEFDYEDTPKVLVTLLARAANAPWAPGRHGFCVDKYPYEKICIPSALTHDVADLDEVIRHEYAHVMTMNRSNGLVPIWLDEATAMVAGGGGHKPAYLSFASGEWPWRKPMELAQAFQENRESPIGRQVVWQAYQQSAAMGEYLEFLKGKDGLGRLLDGYTNNTLLCNLFIRLRGEEPSEEALNEVYDFGIEALFYRTHEWLSSRRSS
jgi:hypothetical protein